MYRHLDAALVRAAVHTGDRDLPSWPVLDGAAEDHVGQWRRWLERVWELEGVAEAVEVASPPLARRVREVCEGHTVGPRQVRRAVVSVVRYLLRMGHRATPFGLFAGIAPARVGVAPEVRWGREHRAVARAGSGWLADVVARLEKCPELLRRLPVMADTTAFVRDDKLVVPFQQPPHDGLGGVTEVSVRHTRAVETVLRAARSPISVADLAGKLAAEYPNVPAKAVDGLLAELVARRVLLTGLRSPMTVTDALGHVVDLLAEVNAGDITDVGATFRELVRIRAELARHNDATVDAQPGIRAAVVERMRALSGGGEYPLMVDLLVDCGLTLPREVAREAERAAAALSRLTPFPSGSPAWRDYHERFLERYGIGALVPVRELLDPDVGLGFPAGYQGSLLPYPQVPLTARDERLVALAQSAAVDGSREIVLDDRTVEELSDPDTRMPAGPELYFHLEAPSREALERGAFDLVVGAMSPAGGSTAGRFLDLFDGADRDRLTAAYAALPTVEPGAVPAQLSSPPLLAKTENIARVPAVLPRVISLAEHGGSGAAALSPDDLAVGGDRHRLYLVALSTRQIVEPAVLNAVELTRFTQPLARFLCELPRAGAAVAPFVWGAARRAPFLPRVRYGRTVLAPARWTLTANDVAGPDAPWEAWAESLTAWRRRFRLPGAVFLGDDDRRLRLDLDEPGQLQLLRAELERSGQVAMSEAPEPSAYGWFDGHAHEIAMPFALERRTAAAPAPPPAVRSVPAGREHGYLPGASPWAFVKLYGHPARHAEILTGHLAGLLEGWDSPVEWWFVPYRDPEPHLRLRLRVSPGDAVWERVGAWAAGLRRRGLTGRVQWDTYYPETGRYGSGAAMAAAESVFAADSAAAIAQMRLTTGNAADPRALTAAGFVDLAGAFSGGTDEGMRRLIRHTGRSSGPGPERAVHDEAVRLADPDDDYGALRAVPGGEDVVRAWKRRAGALAGYAECLGAEGAPEPGLVLASLLHMHHIRAIGLDEASEGVCLRLARSAALSWTVRRGAGP